MRIDSSGNLLVGKTTSSFATAGTTILPSGNVTFTRSGAGVIDVNRLTNDGSLVNFYKNGNTVGSIGTEGGRVTIGHDDAGLKFNGQFDTIHPFNMTTNSNSDAVVSLGNGSQRFKDLYLSGGVYLGGTAAANKLDDYEEGTFTPTWTPASGSGQNITAASGWYTKTGNRVFVDIYLATNGIGTASGNLTLGGLPFTQATNSGQYAALSCGQAANANLVAGQSGAARVNYGAATFSPIVWDATTGTTTMTVSQWGVSGTWRFTGSYQV